MFRPLPTALAILLLSGTALAAPPAPDLSAQTIDSAEFPDWSARVEAAGEDGNEAGNEVGAALGEGAPEGKEAAEAGGRRPDPFLIRVQVLLDRAHVSPGVIDGLPGGNTDKAIRAFQRMRDVEVEGTLDEAFWQLLSADAAPAMRSYVVTQEDADARFVPDLPSDYGKLAELEWAGYRDGAEMLAERFHMDETLLRALNPDADFAEVGTSVLVADTGAAPEEKVSRIVVDKSEGEIFAYDEEDRLVMTAPATIGSQDTPTPSGTMKVTGSARAPTSEYAPDKNFKQGSNHEKLTIPAGPNGPVGTVWIDLAKPTYGIHGTPEPSQIDKTASHGCVRLTNWDAEALASLIRPARTVVEFRE